MDALAAADYLDPPEPTNTVRVRIAVGVAAADDWYARGCDMDDDEIESVGLVDEVMGGDGTPYRLSWVEASVPLPEPPATVEGSVTP